MLPRDMEMVTKNHLLCHKNPCRINLTGERSYDPDRTSIRYEWDF